VRLEDDGRQAFGAAPERAAENCPRWPGSRLRQHRPCQEGFVIATKWTVHFVPISRRQIVRRSPPVKVMNSKLILLPAAPGPRKRPIPVEPPRRRQACDARPAYPVPRRLPKLGGNGPSISSVFKSSHSCDTPRMRSNTICFRSPIFQTDSVCSERATLFGLQESWANGHETTHYFPSEDSGRITGGT